MQFHISLDYPSLKSITDSLTRFSELGLEIHITELDMSLNGDPDFRPEATPEDFLIRQGHRYREVFEIFKAFPAIASVTFWGFHDGHTWLTYLPVEKADWPLPFDAQLQPKYAFWGLADPTKLPSDVYLIGRKNEFRSTAPRGTPVVDGQEDDVWRNAPDMSISIYVQGSGAYGVGKALWDEGNLYVLIKVTDSNLSKKSGNAYEHDSAEIFVDERNDKTSDYQEDDAQYRFNFENAFSSRGNPAEYESAAAVTPTGYNVEVRIPLRFGAGEVGREIGFDLQINDDAGDGTRSSYTKWNDPTNESYRNTSGFGTLVLGE